MDAQGALNAACEQVPRVRKTLKKGKSRQVWSQDECGLAMATALAWFNDQLPVIVRSVGDIECNEVNGYFRELMAYADKGTSRSKYDTLLKDLTAALTKLRADFISGLIQPPALHSDDLAPDFSGLTADAKMQEILKVRWDECVKCVVAEAPLAATVMMGGMLESLLLARVNAEVDKSKIFKCPQIPIDRKINKQIQIQEWMLRTFIDVAHYMGWISQSAKDIGEVLRDYRNYIHPQKQYSHNVELGGGDATLFWQLTKSIARQLAK